VAVVVFNNNEGSGLMRPIFPRDENCDVLALHLNPSRKNIFEKGWISEHSINVIDGNQYARTIREWVLKKVY